MPGTLEAYTHRVGRTGRMNQTGRAITLATADDTKMVKSLERILAGQLVRDIQWPECRMGAQEEKEVDPSNGKKFDPRKAQSRIRGKRSSQRNRARSFDFGISKSRRAPENRTNREEQL